MIAAEGRHPAPATTSHSAPISRFPRQGTLGITLSCRTGTPSRSLGSHRFGFGQKKKLLGAGEKLKRPLIGRDGGGAWQSLELGSLDHLGSCSPIPLVSNSKDGPKELMTCCRDKVDQTRRTPHDDPLDCADLCALPSLHCTSGRHHLQYSFSPQRIEPARPRGRMVETRPGQQTATSPIKRPPLWPPPITTQSPPNSPRPS